jgi:hypothetical protein
VVAVLDRAARLVGGPPQFTAVVAVARRQAKDIADGSLTLAHDADLDLWKMREPGYLVALVEPEPPPSRNVQVLLPVLLSWLVLGVAELSHLVRYRDVPADERPPFFSTWMNGPTLLSPVVLSIVIVISVGWLMWRHHRTGADQIEARKLERAVQGIETELLDPLTRLREQGLAGTVEGTQQRSAEALLEASGRLQETAEQLGGSVAAATELRTVLDRMLAELPAVGPEAVRLAGITGELRDAGDRVRADAQSMADLVGVATQGAVSLETAMTAARDAVARARQIEDRVAEEGAAIHAGVQPFVAASAAVGVAAERLNTTAETLHRAAADLRVALERTRWFSLVADGLRAPGDEDRNGGPGART